MPLQILFREVIYMTIKNSLLALGSPTAGHAGASGTSFLTPQPKAIADREESEHRKGARFLLHTSKFTSIDNATPDFFGGRPLVRSGEIWPNRNNSLRWFV
jgi:hypothetical protein